MCPLRGTTTTNAIPRRLESAFVACLGRQFTRTESPESPNGDVAKDAACFQQLLLLLLFCVGLRHRRHDDGRFERRRLLRRMVRTTRRLEAKEKPVLSRGAGIDTQARINFLRGLSTNWKGTARLGECPNAISRPLLPKDFSQVWVVRRVAALGGAARRRTGVCSF